MQENPLLAPLLERLGHPGRLWKLNELYADLSAANALPRLADDPAIQLYRSNFLIMNALYQLQEEWRGSGWWLQLDSMAIGLQPAGAELRPTTDAPLRDYYLDWDTFWSTDAAEIAHLLETFWLSYAGQRSDEERRRALAELGLAADVDERTLRRRWRELALRHHPDRGGDAATFIRLRLAWERAASGRPTLKE
ncbi:DNA-J related domain-containing protein [Aeromonas simiae]|uniref:Molecular chaperone n=1 Tax=Aeromonas simiae TaxID=218936 RepID=A0A5J6WYR0_9GAMM|nr:DNA-J related domain-containing protein [Aeromonas simiae]QFI56202.1 molecular chaperone [Aeromonas simiae]